MPARIANVKAIEPLRDQMAPVKFLSPPKATSYHNQCVHYIAREDISSKFNLL